MTPAERDASHRLTASLSLIAGPVLALVLAAPAGADEGRLEINQACAAGDGCFAGDDPGFPVEITQAGSYVLTGGLDVPAETTGIALSVNDVHIDLNGMRIAGPVTCEGSPVTSCTSETGTHHGIDGDNVNDISIRHGRLSGFSGHGIILGEGSLLREVTLSENGFHGAVIYEGSRVHVSRASRNLNSGFDVRGEGVVRDSTANHNGGSGIDAFNAARILGSHAQFNGDVGIRVGRGSVVSNVTVHSNDEEGVFTGGSSLIRDSSIVDNADEGVYCTSGINPPFESLVKDVVLDGNNDGGPQFSAPECVPVGDNLCGTDTNCP
ncbi:MAG: hypothetical protein GVY32_01565 [Gammaproteobacteria bacterium]|jgi:hypothetical protein|nr:hypothetical protein [Gammaproteobacteria bacterium]